MSRWPMVALGDVLTKAHEPATVVAGKTYDEITVRMWGKGLVSRGKVEGAAVTSPRRFVRTGQLLLSKIDARNGALGMVPPELDGALVSNDFPSYRTDESRMQRGYLGWLIRTPQFVRFCQASSEGTTNRIRLREDGLLANAIPLPPLAAQQAIVTRLDALAEKSERLTAHWQASADDAAALLAVRFVDLIADAPRLPLGEVAPLQRRPVALDGASRYREVGARSFGKGLFLKPDFDAEAATWQKPVWVKSGDLVLSNIKAWEGAIAVATEEHDGAIASHRYLTCVPDTTQATAAFLSYFLLTSEGLEAIGHASPGTADRNRTTSPKGLQAIPVPLPSLAQQQVFNQLQTKVAALLAEQAAQREQLEQLRQQVLGQAFDGIAPP